MGTTTIDTLISKINNPANINGSMIKVILITPVASEGLSFYNAREIHLVEPWYHFNRSVQIIGRGIRNCRHQQLPFKDRNVTVFMHASIGENIEKESIDLHALRISTRKYSESKEIDKIISNNSLDCILMKNINYFSKSIFKIGKVPIETSQGILIDYEFGDDEKLEPKCIAEQSNIKITGYRNDTYKHLIINTQTLLRKMIVNEIRNDEYFIPLDKLQQMIEIDERLLFETIKSSIYPNILIDGYIILPHANGLHIMKVNNFEHKNLNIIYDKKKEYVPNVKQINNDVTGIISKIKIDKTNFKRAIISLYSSLDQSTFEKLVHHFLTNDTLDEYSSYIASCLYMQGALIGKKEIASYKNDKNNYIGFVNIFNSINDFDVIIYNKNDDKYRDANEKEKMELIKNRTKNPTIPINMSTEKMAWGAFFPKNVKDSTEKINVFKIFTPGHSVGKKTGIDCTSVKKNDHIKIIEDLGNMYKDGTKIQNCITIANELMEKGRMTLLPSYIPTIY
jgi:hypothetical protein